MLYVPGQPSSQPNVPEKMGLSCQCAVVVQMKGLGNHRREKITGIGSEFKTELVDACRQTCVVPGENETSGARE